MKNPCPKCESENTGITEEFIYTFYTNEVAGILCVYTCKDCGFTFTWEYEKEVE